MNAAMPHLRFHDRALALAGAFQALSLVQQTARTGEADPAPLETSIGSILAQDAPTVEAVFGGTQRLQLGLQTFLRHLTRPDARDAELARYWAGVLALERKLSRNRMMMAQLSKTIAGIARGRDDADGSRALGNGSTLGETIEDLARLYQATLSTVTPRIMISGEARILNEPRVAAQIRALLLAAIRATVLWRQLGGTRLGLAFSRRPLAGAAQELVEHLYDGDPAPAGPSDRGVPR